MRKAVVRDSDGLVLNVIEIEGDSTWPTPPDCTLVDAETDGSPGDTWNGEIFIPPEPTLNLVTKSIIAEKFAMPSSNSPAVIDQGNVTLYGFTLNTDNMTYKFLIPSDCYSGDIDFNIVWTNDGGTGDNGKEVKWQLDYQVFAEGDVIDGSHNNSPKSIEDAYTSDSGWVGHQSGAMTIAEADFAGKTGILLKLSAITPSGTPLTGEPSFLIMNYTYNIG